MKTNREEIEKIADKNDVRVSENCDDKDRVYYGLHGFLADIEAVAQQIDGYHIEETGTGFYLYDSDLDWADE